MKKTLLSAVLATFLVLSAAASGLALTFTGDGTWYEKGSTWTSTADLSAGSYNLSFDILAKGTWDALGDEGTKPSTLDTLTIQVLKGSTVVATYTHNGIDIPGLATDDPLPQLAVHLEDLLNVSEAGTYTFKIISGVTAKDESWQFTGGSVSPTPLPAAVWLLGTGVVGLVGLGRRARKAAAKA